jgi:hypothetical protein
MMMMMMIVILMIITPRNRVILEKLTVTQLVKKFPALVPILGQMNPVHSSLPYFSKILILRLHQQEKLRNVQL